MLTEINSKGLIIKKWILQSPVAPCDCLNEHPIYKATKNLLTIRAQHCSPKGLP